MASFDLITLDRAEENIAVSSPNTNILNTLITACSKGIVRYCQREFVQAAYDELYSGFGDRRMFLRHFPILSVQSVRYRPVTVLKIINNNTGTNQQARVAVTSMGLSLQRVASGVSSTDTSVTFLANPTLQAVANAINALGNGWSAQVVGDSNNYGNWPSADLWVPNGDIYNPGGQGQGMLTAAGQNAELKMHTYELAGYQWDAARGWLLRAIPYTDPELLHPDDLVWPVGINNFRVQYTAGFATVPEDVQEACAQWVAELYWQTQRDPGLKSEVIPGSVSRSPMSSMSPGIIELLQPYRAHKILSPGS